MTKKATDKKADSKTSDKTDKTEKAEKVVLNADEKKALVNAESSIRNGLKAFFRVGSALAVIRTDRLYRATHTTFDTYASEKWDMTRARVAQLIASWRIHGMLKDAGFKVLPSTESQCRPFAKIPENTEYDSIVKKAWNRVVHELGEGKKLTASLVSEIVDKLLGIEQKPKESKKENSDSQSTGATGSDNTGDTASEESRKEVRELKAKVAFLESALMAEKQAHKRTRTMKGGGVPNTQLAKDLLKAGFRAMAKKHHPDHGGSVEKMQELNALKQEMGA